MPPNTISPSPSWQGLGITYSTLSPPPASAPQQGFTGMGVGPATRALPQQPIAPDATGLPLFQLRPTHKRHTSGKGFSSFSAIPPSPSVHSHHRQPSTSRSIASVDSDVTERAEPDRRGHDRSGSTVSLASVSSSSRQIKRSKSSDLLRKLSKTETISGGRYIPLSGEEEAVQVQASSSSPPSASRSRSTTISSNTITPKSQSQNKLSTDLQHSLPPGAFPLPPMNPPRPYMTLSDPNTGPYPSFHGMPRSHSQPMHLHNVPELDESSRRPSVSKRSSDLSTGIHSRNAVLLSAESGGMMLAFSPSGDGVWREGELICGGATGLIPTPQTIPRGMMGEDEDPAEMKTRPWRESTGSQQHTRPIRGRSLSDGAAMLARTGTLFHPASNHKRASAELSLMLGGPRSRRLSGNKLLPPPDTSGWADTAILGEADKVKLEAAKKRKARVEVDVVLERECVVEGGEVRGRMEVRVTGGKRGEGLKVGGGKVRVVGFEDISPKSRHIFYHHPHPLPLFNTPQSALGPFSSLFASDPDEAGYRQAAEGVHNIPFRMRLPLGGGAKGSYTSPGKGPCVRYVVVGSIKIFCPATGKRSIAHFYRPIVVLPYLNPQVVLAPSKEIIEARAEKGLGWSITGEKGRVEISVALGRRNWVAGQRIWCEIAVRNDSSRKIKTMALALLQTVQTFNPDPDLSTGQNTPDVDACQTHTQRRKITEEVMEADFGDHGAGRVTGKGWWTGVDSGESERWDMSLLVPNGLISIRRTRLIEVNYTLRVTLNGSIYVDVPVQLINFLSIDPPPMPGDGFRQPLPAYQSLDVKIDNSEYHRPGVSRMVSEESMGSLANPARASSTTLHIDALLQAGRARAEAEGQGCAGHAKARPVSMGSDYDMEPLGPASTTPTPLTTGAIPQRPPHQRFMSYLSTRSAETTSNNSGDEEEGSEPDQVLLAQRRAQGRQRSLAAIHAAMSRQAEAFAVEDDLSSPGMEKEEGEWKPEGTPDEELYDIMADTPSLGSATPAEVASLRGNDVEAIPGLVDGESGDMEVEGDMTPGQRKSGTWQHSVEGDSEGGNEDTDGGDEDVEAGNETVLEDLVSGDGFEDRDEGADEYQEEMGVESDIPYLGVPIEDDSRRISLPRHLPQLDINPRLSIDPSNMSGSYHRSNTPELSPAERQRYDSIVSEPESEVGHVEHAIRRNVSGRAPPRILPVPPIQSHDQSSPVREPFPRLPPAPRSGSMPGVLLSVAPESNGRRSSHTPLPSEYTRRESRQSTVGGARRGSTPNLHLLGIRRDSSNPPVPSPLRQVEALTTSPVREIPKKQSFSFASPGAPLRVRNPSLSPGISPRTQHLPSMLIGEPMARGQSASSQLRNEVEPNLSEGEEDGLPGLAPSVASDSASSEGHALDSPPLMEIPPIPLIDSVMKASGEYNPHSGMKTLDLNVYATSPPELTHTWQPDPHLVHQEVQFLHHHRPTASVDSHDDSEAIHSTMSSTSGHSILPGVRNKIAQLESRDEALRKFSVTAITSTSPYPSLPSPERLSKRRSHTTALAPRNPSRSTSNDILGGTTYVRPKMYSHPERTSYGLERKSSASSTSTSATQIDSALWRNRSPRIGGPREPNFGAGSRGSTSFGGMSSLYEPDYEVGSVGSRSGGGHFRGWPKVERLRASVGSEDSEGLR